MELPEQSYGSVYLPVANTDPALVGTYPDGSLSIELNPFKGFIHFAVVGTPDELHTLADTLRAIVTAHESQTTLAGAGARLAMHQANCGHTWLDANNDDYLECRYCGKRLPASDPIPDPQHTPVTS